MDIHNTNKALKLYYCRPCDYPAGSLHNLEGNQQSQKHARNVQKAFGAGAFTVVAAAGQSSTVVPSQVTIGSSAPSLPSLIQYSNQLLVGRCPSPPAPASEIIDFTSDDPAPAAAAGLATPYGCLMVPKTRRRTWIAIPQILEEMKRGQERHS